MSVKSEGSYLRGNDSDVSRARRAWQDEGPAPPADDRVRKHRKLSAYLKVSRARVGSLTLRPFILRRLCRRRRRRRRRRRHGGVDIPAGSDFGGKIRRGEYQSEGPISAKMTRVKKVDRDNCGFMYRKAAAGYFQTRFKIAIIPANVGPTPRF